MNQEDKQKLLGALYNELLRNEKFQQFVSLQNEEKTLRLTKTSIDELTFGQFYSDFPYLNSLPNKDQIIHIQRYMIDPSYKPLILPSYRTFILYLYYRGGCEPLNLNKIYAEATDTDYKKIELRNSFIELRKVGFRYDERNYKPNGRRNVLNGFVDAYEYLLAAFKSTGNTLAYAAVNKDYEELKTNYLA